MVKNGAVVAAGLVAERAGNKTLADAGLPDDQQILMTLDPVAGDELGKQRLVEPARCFEIDVLDDGRLRAAAANLSRVASRLFSRSMASRSTREGRVAPRTRGR